MTPRIIIVVAVLLSASLIGLANAGEPLQETYAFVESFEWDPMANSKIGKYKQYEKTYLNFIRTTNEEQVYLGSIMLGLLKRKAAVDTLRQLKPKAELSKIGVLFSLCVLKQDYSENYAKLENLGRETQSVGGAKSLVNLNAIELLSFLADPRFRKYVSSLSTDEVFQSEAISVSIARYEAIVKNGF